MDETHLVPPKIAVIVEAVIRKAAYANLATTWEAVKQYLDDLDRADRQRGSVPEARTEHLKQKIATIRSEVRKSRKIKAQLPDMSRRARKALSATDLTALADRGYFSGEELLKCEQAGMTPMVPKPLTSNGKADRRFDKRDYVVGPLSTHLEP